MNTVYRKYSGAVALTAALVLTGTSCSTDWGQQDPIPGVQTLPKLENVATFEFEEDALDPLLLRAHGNQNQTPSIIEDDLKGKVLELNDGWVEMNNPLRNSKCEKAASFTFWMKQLPAVTTDEEGNDVTEPQDVTSPLFRFSNINNTGSLTFSANGGIEYDAPDGTWSCDNPGNVTTGYIPVGGFDGNGWNYVALTIGRSGYSLFVNGEKKADTKVTDFKCDRLVDFMNNVSDFSIGSKDNHGHWLIDDFKMWRNELTAKETARPRASWETAGPGGFDFDTFEYLVGTPKLEIGTPDFTTPWWSDFSNYYRIPADTNLRLSFVNRTSGANNWNNWCLCLSTDADRGVTPDYKEYFVIRSDLYGWGDAYSGENWSNEGYGDWDQFRRDMDGADVTVDIRRDGAEVNVTATAIAADGTRYVEKFHATCDEGDQIVRAFLIVDGSYIEMNSDRCFAYWDADVASDMVGASDCSTGWWTEFSDYFPIRPDLSLHLGLLNFTSGGGNWNNWNLCVCTDADRGAAPDYKEYFVIRSDLYGWGDAYSGDNWSSEGYGDWDQFRLDMNGAYVDIDIVRDAAKITASAAATAENGTVYKESFFADCGDGTQPVRAFLIVDGSHLELEPSDCYTYKALY